MLCTDNTDLSHNEVDCSNKPCMILHAVFTGTDVNSAVTSYEQDAYLVGE